MALAPRSAASRLRALPNSILPRPPQLAGPRQPPAAAPPRPSSSHAASLPPRRWQSSSSSSTTTAGQNPSAPFSSVNPDEVSHFTELASEWWDPHGSSRLLHLMNPLRHDFINACLDSQLEPRPDQLSYLDIGCGGGIFAESAARLRSTRSVLAIDPTPSVLAVARAHARKDPGLARKLKYRNCSVEELEVPGKEGKEGGSGGEPYDIVSLFEVIEHIDQPGAFLDRVQPFVRPGGWLVMSTIARTWTSWFTTNLVAEDLLGIVPKGTHDWNKYLNDDELHRFFVDKGWNSPRVMGVVYVPGLGWKQVRGSEKVGNYFFAIRRNLS